MSDSTNAGPGTPTLAALVRELAPGVSWEQARTLCRTGRVWVDGRLATEPAARLAAGRRVEVLAGADASARRRAEAEAAGEEPAQGTQAPSLVVYADAAVVVVRKPAGILTVPFDRGDRDTLLALTRVALRRIEAGEARRRARPGARTPASNPTLRAVQRLDKDTSGLVVFARQVAVQRNLQQQLVRGEVIRRYEALAHGAACDATYDTWLVGDRGDGRRGSSETWREGAHRAVTHVRVLARLRGATRLACELETGRQHQIRIHLAEAGHPLIGETVYLRDFRGPRIAAPRPMLHAAVLGFFHPGDGRALLFEEPPPADLAAALERLAVR